MADMADVVDVAVLVNEEEAEVKIYLFDQIFKFHKFIIYLLFNLERGGGDNDDNNNNQESDGEGGKGKNLFLVRFQIS